MSERGTARSLDGLIEAGLLEPVESDGLAQVADRYAIAVTPHLMDLIDRSDETDPIARMFVPSDKELARTEEELSDPIGDETHSPVRGVVHRYPNRVLLKPVGVCPVYCRFCFRREMVGPENGGNLTPDELEHALDYIRKTPAVREIILTGGDPFMLSARRARALTQALDAIPHIDVIRWHTRMPVADPARITAEYVDALRPERASAYVSVHINHAREFSDQTAEAVAMLAEAGIPLLSQTVLLRGVNDTADALSDLFETLVRHRVRPYYLHHPDLAPGTGHFRLPVAEGQALYSAVRDRVSGIALPHYVIDIPGGVSKANAAASDVHRTDNGMALRGRDGKSHAYDDHD